MVHAHTHLRACRREVSILRQLRHACIVELLDVLPPPDDPAQFRDLYLVFEYALRTAAHPSLQEAV